MNGRLLGKGRPSSDRQCDVDPPPPADVPAPRRDRHRGARDTGIGLFAGSSSAGSNIKDGHGLLTVKTSPSVASQITVGGIQRNSSLVWGLELPVGSYLVCFGPVDGYIAPPCETLDIVEGQTLTHVGTLEPAGKLKVTTEPSGASGKIVVNDITRDRGAVTLPVAAGEHVVCFEDVEGYESPDCERVNVDGGGSVSVTGSYVLLASDPSDSGPVEGEP